MTITEAPIAVDTYEPGENCNPKDSGYHVRREWYCEPPAMTEQFYVTDKSGWIWEPETNTYVRQVFAWASEVPTPSPEPPADHYPPERS